MSPNFFNDQTLQNIEIPKVPELSYAEAMLTVKGLKYAPLEVVDWPKLLSQPDISLDEWSTMRGLAGNWVTCACGNQCSVLPRTLSGKPEDEDLSSYGAMFYDAVCRRDRTDALHMLELIEKRSMQLLAELLP